LPQSHRDKPKEQYWLLATFHCLQVAEPFLVKVSDLWSLLASIMPIGGTLAKYPIGNRLSMAFQENFTFLLFLSIYFFV